ncbi:oligosaccharide flippase family protein [Pseudomonas sp. SWRI74]|uniref:Oligosaccharide flippase family protein n=1 Tax=Pseudomonas azerbaijanoccidentalis TaxID=2842347 RepID=A0ABS6QIM6_9PSED|nr:oligosaccharide flippase family protein [Pseudomonas azerbaijanoccidentalis]MBV4518792.1 oligosaccharide flippase family protein [Pseudomonas azerbaijanoccidentalis]
MANRRLTTLGWIFTEKFGLIFLSMITFVVYARLLSPAELGVGTIIIAIVELIGLIYSSVLEDPLVRLERLEDKHISTAFWAAVLVSLVSIVVISGAATLYTSEPMLQWMTAVASVKILFTMMARVYVAQMRRSGDFKTLASRTLLGKVFGGVGGIAVALWGFGAWAVIAQALIMELVSIIVLMRADPRRIAFHIDGPFLRELLRAGTPVAINALSSQTLQRGVNVVLGMAAGANAVGMFNMAMRIIDLPRTAIYNGLLSYALPAFSRRSAEPSRLLGIIDDSTAVSGFLLTPLFLGIALTASDVILLIFGAKWAEAIPLLQVLACAAAIGNTAMYATTALVAVNRSHLTIKAEVVTTLLALALVYGLGSVYGGMAAALALLARMLIITPLQIRGLNAAIGYGWRRFFDCNYRSVIASLVMAATVLYVSPLSGFQGYLHLICNIVVGALSYAVAYSVMHPRWPQEFKSVFTTR